MAEQGYIKSHQFDRVLNYYWAEQAIGGGIFELLEQQRQAHQAADRLAGAIKQQEIPLSCQGDNTRMLEHQRRALATAGGMGQVLQRYQEVAKAFAQVGKALEEHKVLLEAAGGMDRFLERHQMFMAAAREFSPIFTIERGKRSGQPCIRGIRMTINDVLEYLTSGMTDGEILHDFPDLTQEDLDTCRAFGAFMEERFKSLES